MTPRVHTGAWRGVALAAAMVVGAGCSGPSAAVISTPSSSTIGTPEQSNEPEGKLDAYIRSRIGRSPKEIYEQHAQVVVDATVACMEATGFAATDVSPLVETVQQSDDVKVGIGAGSATSWAISSLTMYQETAETNPEKQPSIELQQAWYNCQTQATNENPDLIQPFYEQLNTSLDEHNSRVEADPRFRAAESELEACHQQYGYTAESLDAKKTMLHEQASAIVDKVANRELSSDEALTQVEALNTQEIETLGDVEECQVPYNGAVAEISDEVDLSIIEANAAAFDEIFDQINASLAAGESATSNP